MAPRSRFYIKKLCSYRGCTEILRIRKDQLADHSGKCISHAHVKRPFESIYNRLYRDRRKIDVRLSYDQFVRIAKKKYCHYCGVKIERTPFSTFNGTFLSAAYFLDRKDNRGPYSIRNCVACCTQCNCLKGNRFSYKEFKIIGNVLWEIRLKRKGKKWK